MGPYIGETLGRARSIVHFDPLLAAARKSLEFRLCNKGGRTGWSRAWIANMWARFGDGDRAYEALKALLVENTSDALLDLHPPGIFQMDGNGGATAAIAEVMDVSSVHSPGAKAPRPPPIIAGTRSAGKMACTGHAGSHAPQSMQTSGSM